MAIFAPGRRLSWPVVWLPVDSSSFPSLDSGQVYQTGSIFFGSQSRSDNKALIHGKHDLFVGDQGHNFGHVQH